MIEVFIQMRAFLILEQGLNPVEEVAVFSSVNNRSRSY